MTRHTPKSRLGLATSIWIGLLLPACASAQRNETAYEATHAADCRLAAQVLETGRPEPRYGWALATVARCEQTGPAALAAVWTNPPTDPVALDLLAQSSVRLRDQAVVAALTTAARQPGTSLDARAVALVALASYVRPAFDLDWRLLVAGDTSLNILPGSVSGRVFVDGPTPPGDDNAASVRATLSAIAATDPDPRVRHAARIVLDGL